MKDGEWTLPSWLLIAVERLNARRIVLAAAIVSLIAVDLLLGGNGVAALVATIFLLVIIALLPPGGDEGRKRAASGTEADPMNALSAVELAAAVQDPLYIADRSGAVLYANSAAEIAFGPIARGGSLQLKFRSPEMHDFIGRVLEGKEAPSTLEYIERVPFERAYLVSAVPIGKADSLFALLFKDQSEARRIDRMRSDFIANASHELRTPLASIAGFIETLRGPARDDAEARENFLQIMHDQTGRMARLLDDLLSLSRLEAKPYMRPTERVDLNPLLETMRNSFAQVAENAGIVIELDLPEGRSEVAGDHDELVQVFENLIENACRYGGSGGRVVVSIQKAGRNAETRVTVSDFGPGIAEEHVPRITERFYRVDAETSRAYKGTGLGLAIVKHILTRHGARLSVRSKLGQGSSFTVHFPPEG